MKKDIYELVVCPVSNGNQRNSEASILELKDGRLLLAYSDFYEFSDFAAARISGKISEDGGISWGEKFTLQENVAKVNVMDPSLLRLMSGEMALFYLHKNSETDCLPNMKKSYDEGQSWKESTCLTTRPGYFCMNNDRAVQLTSGRLLAPVSYTPDCWRINHFTSLCLYSDDNGQTWKEGETEIDLPKRGADEPAVVELKDGSVLMVIRNQLGRIYKSYSYDEGINWTKAEPMGLISPESPATIKRIPTTGDLLIIWNNGTKRRNPLTVAVSKDEGHTWENVKNIENDERYTYAYPSLTFVDNKSLITYYVGEEEKHWWALKLKIISIDWFYQ